MNLHTLPTEILVQIFKNSNITSIENMKNVHSRFRDIIVRWKLDYITASRLTISRSIEISPTILLQQVFKLDVEIHKKNYGKILIKRKIMKLGPVNNHNSVETAKQLREGLIEFKINAIESLHFENIYNYVDTNVLFHNSGIDFSGLHACTHPHSKVNLTFLDDEMFKKILSKNPQNLDFEECKTPVTVPQIITIIKANLSGNRSFNWNFGRIEAKEADVPAIFESVKNIPVAVFINILDTPWGVTPHRTSGGV